MITFFVDNHGNEEKIEVPEGIQLSLMEVLKASEYPVLATCGGMALCATCHVAVVSGGDALPPIGDAEGDMLDTLPDADATSRLACQLPVDESLEGAVFQLRG